MVDEWRMNGLTVHQWRPSQRSIHRSMAVVGRVTWKPTAAREATQHSWPSSLQQYNMIRIIGNQEWLLTVGITLTLPYITTLYHNLVIHY